MNAVGRWGTSRGGFATSHDSVKVASPSLVLRTLLATLLILGSSLSLVDRAGAATLAVCPSGCPYTTITAAVAAAAPNDTITVGAGNYYEYNIYINKPLRIIGAGRDVVTVTGSNTLVPAGPAANYVFNIDLPAGGPAGIIELTGMTVTDPPRNGNTTASRAHTIHANMQVATTPVTEIYLHDMNVQGSGTTAYEQIPINFRAQAPGGVMSRPPIATFDNLDVTRKSRQGILIEDWFAPVTLTNSYFDPATNGASYSDFLAHSSLTSERNPYPYVIQGNEFEGSGIWFSACNRPNLRTTFAKGGYDNIQIDSNRFSRLIDFNSAISIGVGSCSNPLSAQSGPSSVTKMGSVQITNNVIESDGTRPNIRAIRVAGPADSVVITDNSITGTPRAVLIQPGGPGTGATSAPTGAPSSVVINRNRLLANTNGVQNEAPTNIDANDNWWGCQDGPTGVPGPTGSWYCSQISNTGAGSVDASTWIVTTPTLDLPFNVLNPGVGTATLGLANDGAVIPLEVVFDQLAAAWENVGGSVDPVTGLLDYGTAQNTAVTVPGALSCGTYWTTLDYVLLAAGPVTGEPVPIYWCVIKDPGFLDEVPADNGTPVSFALTSGSLPAGLTLDPVTGAISGDPGEHGKFVFKVTVTYADGKTDVLDFTYLIVAPPVITNEVPDNGSVGTPYTHNMTADGATPITYSIVDGALPPGLTLDPATGVISGTPTTAGTYTFTVQAENMYGTDAEEYTVVIGTPPTITSVPPPDGEVDVQYQHEVTATGDPTITFSIVGGSLPDGLELDPATGIISGTPLEYGTFTFQVRATNEWGTDTEEYTITIGDPPIINTGEPPDAELGDVYSHTVGAEGATPMTYSIVGGALPDGLTLDPVTGIISGTTTAYGSFTFTVQAENEYGTDTAEYTVVIGDPPIITSGDPADGEIGSGYVHTVTADGATPMTYSIVGGSLPPGLTLDPKTGVISGTPTEEGGFTFTVQAENQYGIDTAEYSIVIGKDPVITSDDPPDGQIDLPYDFTVVAGGPGPITFAIVAGALPDGLTLDPATGRISGTPTATGTFTFTVRAQNAYGVDDVVYTIVIDETPPTTTTTKVTTSTTKGSTTSTTSRSGAGGSSASTSSTSASSTSASSTSASSTAATGSATGPSATVPSSSRDSATSATRSGSGSAATSNSGGTGGVSTGGSTGSGVSSESGGAGGTSRSSASVSGRTLSRPDGPSAVVAGATLDRSGMARTGFGPEKLLLIGGAMLLFGVCSVAAARRRKRA